VAGLEFSNEQPNRSVTLRPVGPNDEALLLALYASTRADELALLSWGEEQQRAFVGAQFAAQQEHYQKLYPQAKHDIILAGDRPIGRLYVAWLDQEIRIVDITLLPDERSAGIGSYLLRGLLGEGARAGKKVRIYVESFNRSLGLFERLGFLRAEQRGIHVLMEHTPAAP
jgi:ribosomal protein S18 acetylase RimI-like enzyme